MSSQSSIERPLIVIGAPRSGTTILRHCLAQHPSLWHPRAESHSILEGPVHPAPDFESNRCTASDLSEKECGALRLAFYRAAMNLNVLLNDASLFFRGRTLLQRAVLRLVVPGVGSVTKAFRPSSIRLLEKTPKNSLRVSLLNRLFPDAYFVWNKREPEKNVDSLIAGWRTTDTFGPIEQPRFATYDVAGQLNLQDYEGVAWKFALIPEWRSLEGRRVADVAAWQYLQCNRYALRDFEEIKKDRLLEVKHEEFVGNPLATVQKIVDWAGLSQSRSVDQFASSLPKVNDTHTAERDQQTGLRYPKEVRRSLSELPDLPALLERMGYEPSAVAS